jgi:septal ring factor EnvC (AmiA/AmiB activator)
VKRPALLLGLALVIAAPAGGQSPSPSPSAASAPPAPPAADERLKKVQERRASLEAEVARLRAEEKSLLGEVERLELEVRLRGEQLREAQLLLQRTNAQLDATLKRSKAIEAQVRAERPLLKARARDLYKLGDVSYMRLLLSVERPADFLNGYRYVTTLARRDNQRIAAFRADLATLAATRQELETKTGEAVALRAELQRMQRQLEADRSRKTDLLTSIVERKETNAAYVQELQDAEARLKELIAGLGDSDVAVPAAVFKGSLPWPVKGRVRVPFGLRKHPRFDTYTVQNGIEIAAAAETRASAVYDGIVVFADRFKGYGVLVVVDHGGKHHTLYGHLASASVQPGQRVAAGDTVGLVGSGLEGSGLYFEVRFQGRPEDPLDWLKKDER